MPIIFTFIFFIIGLFPSLLFSNFNGGQSKANDTIIKNDINSIYQKLEEHFNDNGDYPTKSELSANRERQFPGIDSRALIDDAGLFINEAGSDYKYTPSNCIMDGCSKYVLSATLADRTTYSKESLN